MHERRATLVLALLGACIGGCSSQQVYGAAQAWQRRECYRIDDAQERRRCLASTATSYESYQREAAAAKSPP